ncbi:MAG TPA: hypothetical protein VE871_11110 [Longimicrobium sp.]|nr:hypothetical protein [Longimicrobium sp.]
MTTFRSAVLATLALAAPLAPASAQSAPANPGFEEGAPTLTGWVLRGEPAYVFALDSAHAREGRWAARVTWQGGGAPNTFGTLLQRVDAAPYRGRACATGRGCVRSWRRGPAGWAFGCGWTGPTGP